MKKIIYYNKELKDGIDSMSESITDADYEIKQVSIEVAPEDVDYYLNIITTSYGQYGEVTVQDGDLQIAKSNKISELHLAYNDTLAKGFTSDANGTATSFAYNDASQIKFMKLLMCMTAGLLNYPVTVYSITDAPVTLTEEQLKHLYVDLTTFEFSNEGKLHEYLVQVNECTTVDEVSAINWE